MWPKLRAIPKHFILYGGTAIALRLGHRQSIDFDFFSHEHFQPQSLQEELEFLKDGVIEESKINTLTKRIGEPPVKISFFGGLTFGHTAEPEECLDNGLAVASLLDLAALKMAVIQQRAEKKDYLDIEALLKAGVKLSEALSAAQALYPKEFAPVPTLKALCYFKDGDLPSLSTKTQKFLCSEASKVEHLPAIVRISHILA